MAGRLAPVLSNQELGVSTLRGSIMIQKKKLKPLLKPKFAPEIVRTLTGCILHHLLRFLFLSISWFFHPPCGSRR